MRIVTAAEMKQIEKNADTAGLSYYAMMENAGRASAVFIKERLPRCEGARVLVFAGKGNNGGDGFVAARFLREAGANVKVVLAEGLPRTEDARTNLRLFEESGAEVLALEQQEDKVKALLEYADAVVDALYGTGFHGAMNEAARRAAAMMNGSTAPVFALDLPSGVNSDSGAMDSGAVNAAYTVVFDSMKPAHVIYPALEHCGEIVCEGIGIDPVCRIDAGQSFVHITNEMVFSAIPERSANSHKGTFGKLLNIASSAGMTGAARLSVQGAQRVGAGLVVLGTPKSLLGVHEATLTEAVFLPLEETAGGTLAAECIHMLEQRLPEMSACAVGCGLAANDDTAAVVDYLLTHAKCPLLIDADGINVLARNINKLCEVAAPIVLTPHPAEMARLLGIPTAKLLAKKVEYGKGFAVHHRVTLVLKGANTLIFTPQGEVLVNTTGNSGLAKGGSGDVLAGMIAGFLAQGLSAPESAMCGVYLHGKAGDRCARRLSRTAMQPSDLMEDICSLFLEHGR